MMTHEPIRLTITLPNIPEIELVAVEGLNRLAARLGITDEKLGEARILVTEAIINALEHGGATGKGVRVEFRVDRETLVILVRDYGKGFDPSAVEKPDLRSKLGTGHKRGWGLKLMQSMSDDFRLESTRRGTKITLTKKLT